MILNSDGTSIWEAHMKTNGDPPGTPESGLLTYLEIIALELTLIRHELAERNAQDRLD